MRVPVALAVFLSGIAIAAAHGEGRLTAGGAPITPEELFARARAAQVVYVGEEHGRADHHRLQAALLDAMADAGPVALGCEYFPRSLQPVLDRFNAGELTVEELPAALVWEKTWGFPFEAYRPLFEVCRARGIPIVALNAERAFVRRVRQAGLAGLKLEELLALPPIELAVPEHRERVVAQLERVHPMPPELLARYYEAFTVWDEVMADSVCQAFLRDRRPGLKMLVVAGRGHIETGTGIPDRVSRRLPGQRLVVVCGAVDDDSWADVIMRPRPPRSGWF